MSRVLCEFGIGGLCGYSLLAKTQNIFSFKGLPGFTPFNIRGECIQGHFLIVNPPMRCKIQCSSVSLWSDNRKCQNVQYLCLEMSLKVIWAWQEFEQTNITKSNMLFVDMATSTKPCVCCITYSYCSTNSIKSFVTVWKKLLCRCWTVLFNLELTNRRSAQETAEDWEVSRKSNTIRQPLLSTCTHTRQNYSSGIHPPGRSDVPNKLGRVFGKRKLTQTKNFFA